MCEERIKTFKDWPRFHHIQSDDLARCGFWYTQLNDTVACFYCGVSLKDWCKEDSVFDEHLKWRPNCNFLKMCYYKAEKPVQFGGFKFTSANRNLFAKSDITKGMTNFGNGLDTVDK